MDALVLFDAFSSREPGATSLENALERRESEFRAEERKERAEEIHLDDIEAHAKEMASTQPHEAD
jgi:hypothetical protein